MTEENEIREVAGITRRSMIKRVGLGAAVAWSAPVLTTVGISSAAGTPVCQPGDRVCPQPACGDSCTCLSDVDGNAFCHEIESCSNVQSCTSTAQCPDGYVCAPTCCNFGNPVCVRACEGGIRPQGVLEEPTTASA